METKPFLVNGTLIYLTREQADILDTIEGISVQSA